NLLVEVLHWRPIPYEWCHSPFQQLSIITISESAQAANYAPYRSEVGMKNLSSNLTGAVDSDVLTKIPAALTSSITTSHGIMNLPALFIVSLMSLLLIKGTQESAIVNNLIVILKVTIVVLIIVLGWGHI